MLYRKKDKAYDGAKNDGRMKIKIVSLILALQCFSFGLQAQGNPFLFKDEERKIFINNRVLAKVNDKAISVIDVMKKMDLQFYKQYPQYADSIEARYQFYQISWKHALQELIDKELVIADAIANKVEISPGDIRQEMETLFGPKIIANLDTAGLTFDEAYQMIKDDLLLRRMLNAKVNALAVRMVTPHATRLSYEEYIKNKSIPDILHYYVISIRGDDAGESAEIATRAHSLLTNENVSLSQVAEKVNLPEGITLKVSDEFALPLKDISETYRNTLSKMESNSYSLPLAQQSRTEKATVFRIFYLKDIEKEVVTPFSEIESKLKDRLIDQLIGKETDIYLLKLRKHYNLNKEQLAEMVPEDFVPFVLR